LKRTYIVLDYLLCLCWYFHPNFFDLCNPSLAKSGDASVASAMPTNSSFSSNLEELLAAQIQAPSTQSAKMDLDGTDSPWGGK
jgi:hypothetical protein